MAKTSPRRKHGRPRGAQARANADLSAHIASLGLRTVPEYQRWCREHGFTAALNKGWQDRRAERDTVKRDAVTATADAAVTAHVQALGLVDLDAYQAWCREQGLSDGLHKGPRQRRKEIDLARDLASRSALRKVRQLTRRPRDTIGAIFAGAIALQDLRPRYLGHVARHAAALEDRPAARGAFRDLLLAAEVARADLFDVTAPAITRFGPRDGNTWLDGLAALARRHEHWLQSPDGWRPAGHGPRRHFASLARHLLAHYEVPAPFDTVFFLDDPDEAARQQSWFEHVGAGGNLRTAPGLPVALTKRMAHEVLRAPERYHLVEALRYGQIVGQEGGRDLVETVLATRLGESFAHEEFWSTFVHWLTRHPMLDPEWVGPIADYVQEQKYERQEIALPGGGTVWQDPPQPNFSMKSRSVDKLLRQVEEWHARLARDQRVPTDQWSRCDIGELSVAEPDRESGKTLTWSVRELTSTDELVAEGKAMHHCVRSYADNCRRGRKAVFSLQIADEEGNHERLMTIAVNPSGRRVTEARGRFNALPGGRIVHKSKKSLDDRYRRYLRRSRSVLRQWEEQEGVVGRHQT